MLWGGGVPGKEENAFQCRGLPFWCTTLLVDWQINVDKRLSEEGKRRSSIDPIKRATVKYSQESKSQILIRVLTDNNQV